MNWVYRALCAPMLWAIAFAALYALHGYGCARGWQAIPAGIWSLHSLSMLAAYVVAVALLGAVLLWGRASSDNPYVRLGDIIGFAATLLTLWPAVGISSCFG